MAEEDFDQCQIREEDELREISEDVSQALFGFSLPEIRAAVLRIRPRFRRGFLTATCLFHTSTNWALMSVLSCHLGYTAGTDPALMRREVVGFFREEFMRFKRLVVDHEVRFKHAHDLFPMVFGIIDTVPTHICAKDDFYDGKYKQKVLKTQVAITLAGCPYHWIIFRSRAHDKRIFVEGESIPHKDNEFLLADLAYVSSEIRHVVVPYKKARAQSLPSSAKKANQRHSWMRSRVERTFAWANRHRLFTFSPYRQQRTTDLLDLLFTMEHFAFRFSEKRPYDDVHEVRKRGKTCTCAFRGPDKESLKWRFKYLRKATWKPTKKCPAGDRVQQRRIATRNTREAAGLANAQLPPPQLFPGLIDE